MAYNPYLANNYMYPQFNQQVQPQQIQNGGFIPAPSEAYARNYPVAPGNSITFKDEGQPYVYVKTMGFNQMEPPTFRKYKLVEEVEDLNTIQPVADAQPASWASKADLEEIRQAYATLSDKVEMIRQSVNLFTDKETDNV